MDRKLQIIIVNKDKHALIRARAEESLRKRPLLLGPNVNLSSIDSKEEIQLSIIPGGLPIG